MKVIFLDIDGVMNTERYVMIQCEKHGRKYGYEAQFHFDPQALRNLKRIVKKTNAKIVISSTWRIRQDDFESKAYLEDPKGLKWRHWNALLANLEKIGIADRVIGVTPHESIPDEHGRYPRGNEIRKWLEDNKDLGIENFVIIDDGNDMCEMTDTNLAWCQWMGAPQCGLIDSVADKAIEILGGNYAKEG